MAEIVITIPNAQVGRAVDALCIAGNYQGDPDDQPARREFARQVVARYIRRTVLQVERQQALDSASATVRIEPLDVE